MKNIHVQDESGDRKYFTIIPNYILNHSTLWDREVYVQMKRITGENGTCWTSQKTLAKQCGMSINRLKKSIQYLIDHEWIKQIGKKDVVTKGGMQEVKEYRVLDLWKKNVDFFESKGVSSGDIPKAKGVSFNDTPTPQRGVTVESKGVSPGDDKEEPIQEEHNTGDEVARVPEVIKAFETVDPKNKTYYKNTTQRDACVFLIKEYGIDRVFKFVSILPRLNEKKLYIRQVTTPWELKENWVKIGNALKQQKDSQKDYKIAFN